MKLRTLQLQLLDIPFVTRFDHAHRSRTCQESILVRAETDSGIVGYGEGCPRDYVTGENFESARKFFDAHAAHFLGQTITLKQLSAWVERSRSVIDCHPAAWCAMELAILDALGRHHRQSLERLLGLPELKHKHRYTAVLGDQSGEMFKDMLTQYLAIGLTTFKVKLSGDIDHDLEKCNYLKAMGITECRADANNLWDNTDDAINHLTRLNYTFTGIEEPIEAHRITDLSTISRSLGIPVILDESLLTVDQLDNLPGATHHWILNVRVSKMGGLIRSLRIIARARTLGLTCIVGAQVGETSLLTRVSLTVAEYARDILVAQEGAFGSYLLEYDITEPEIKFGEHGVLNPSLLLNQSIGGNGLKVTLCDRE